MNVVEKRNMLNELRMSALTIISIKFHGVVRVINNALIIFTLAYTLFLHKNKTTPFLTQVFVAFSIKLSKLAPYNMIYVKIMTVTGVSFFTVYVYCLQRTDFHFQSLHFHGRHVFF